jgi:hypothetical protein
MHGLWSYDDCRITISDASGNERFDLLVVGIERGHLNLVGTEGRRVAYWQDSQAAGRHLRPSPR